MTEPVPAEVADSLLADYPAEDVVRVVEKTRYLDPEPAPKGPYVPLSRKRK